MRMKTFLVGAAVASLVATPVVAQAARSAAPVNGESSVTGEGVTRLIVLAAIVGAILIGIELSDDEPSSP